MSLTYWVTFIFLVSSSDVSSSSDITLNIVRHEIQGRAEIFHNGSWGTICDYSWNKASSTVFCRMHGYGSGVSVLNINTVDGSGNIHLDNVQCAGSELSLDDCTHRKWGVHDCSHTEDTGVHCIGQLYRISGHFGRGTAEVYYMGKWGRISDNNWTDNDAKVFCKSIGYRSGKKVGNPPRDIGLIWQSNIQCKGSESNIMLCVHSQWNKITSNSVHVVAVECEEARVRVVEKHIFGRAEIYHNNIWGTICDDHWSVQDSKVFCKELGYSDGSVKLNVETEDGTGEMWLDDVKCNGNEAKLTDCPHLPFHSNNCKHTEDTGVNCAIASKRLHNDGYAEVLYNGEWGRICDGHWNTKNSILFCQELGYTSGITVKSLMSTYLTKAWLQNVQCSGRESYIDQCDHSDWEQQHCTSGNHVRLHCFRNSLLQTVKIKVSLSDGAEGTVNITIKGGTKMMLTADFIHNYVIEALCKEVGYSIGLALPYVHLPAFPSSLCVKYIHPFKGSWIINHESCRYGSVNASFIKCGNEIYRVVGKDNNEGRLEVNINGVWGNLCSSSWNDTSSKLACNALGFQDGVSVPGGNFKSPITKTWMRNVNCTMQSKSLSDCEHILVDQDTCPKYELIGVKCFNVKVRLISGGNTDLVQVFYNGIWGFIDSNKFRNKEARVICKMLGFTSASYSNNYNSNANKFVIKSLNCHGNESMITECADLQWTNSTSHNHAASVQCSSDVRFYKNRRRNGVIEILNNNKWGGICGRAWTRNDAAVACRSMGYLSGVVYEYKHHIRDKGLLYVANCSGNEDNLKNCPHGNWGLYHCYKWAGAECSHYKIRLRNGKSPNEGRVEILQYGLWGTVCDKNWNHEAASVICRSLGYTQGVSYGAWKFGQGKGTIWFDGVNCNGDESCIDHCVKTPWTDKMACNHSHDAGVVCLDKGVRLVDGDTEKEGRVEIFQAHKWGSLCSDYWNNDNAMVVCRMLGYMYGTGYQITKNLDFIPIIPPLLIQAPLNCNGNESSVFDCPVFASKRCHYPGAQVFCGNVGIRLVDKISDNAGSIEVLLESKWRSICPDSWEEIAAHTVCNMMGFVDGFGLTQLKTPPLPRFITHLSCTGSEESIDECAYQLSGPLSCSTSSSVGVFCSMVDMRINNTVPGSSVGYLEILYDGIWGSVCNTNWTNNNAAVACRSLGYRHGGAVSSSRLPVISNTKHQSWIDNVQCHGNESSILACKHGDFGRAFCNSDHFATLNCKNFIGLRLEDGRNSSEGRVEVLYQGTWGTVCLDDWDNRGALVTCKMLGYRYGIATQTDIFVPSKKPIWLNHVKCRGGESSLLDCPHVPWKWNQCNHRREAGAICHNGLPPTTPNKNIIIG